MMAWPLILAGGVAMVISFGAGYLTRRIAKRTGMLDRPSGHKAHARAVPLLGGCAIFAGVALPILAAAGLAGLWAAGETPAWLGQGVAEHVDGAVGRIPMAIGILAGAAVLHVMGLVDDRRALGPWPKLAVQFLVAVCVAGFCGVRVLTVAGGAVSTVLTAIWLVVVMNALNFLDNMDGLSAGVGAICAAGLLGVSVVMGQVFVSAWLCLLLGALLGFLPHNVPPAKSFMGDAGSLVVGYFLGVLTCLTTFVRPGRTYYLYGIFVPLVLLAVPLYDMISVIVLRVRSGTSPLLADRRHFSHRLVRRGMAPRAAVLTIYLCTAVTSASAWLLALVSTNHAAVLVFAQTAAVILLVALLEGGGDK